MNQRNKGRAGIVSVITTPLGFFALSLLIVEGFLGIILVGSNLNPDQKFWGLIIGAALFVMIVTVVTVLVWYKPQNIAFSGEEHIQHDKMALGDQDTNLPRNQAASTATDGPTNNEERGDHE